MKKVIFFSAWLLLAFIPGFTNAQNAASDSLTLSKAINLATHNQPLLREAANYVKASEGKIKQTESSKYPQVSAVLSYAHIGPVPYFSFTTPLGTESIDVAPANDYNGQVEVRYLIFDFNRRNEWIKLLKSNKLAQEEKINLLKNRLAYSTVQAFYSVLFLRESLKVKEQQRQDLLRHLDLAKKLVETGSAVSLDTLTTRVRVTAIENQKIGIENLLQKSEIALKSLLNLPRDTTLAVTGDFMKTVPHFSADSLIHTAWAHREEIRLTQVGQQAAGIQKEIARRSAAPTLSAIASAGTKNGYPDALNRLRGNWMVGLQAAFPIYEGGLKKAKIETAAWNAQAVNEHLEALKKTVSREVQQAASDLLTSEKQLKMAQQEILSAQAAIKQARVNYRSGYATNLTLLDAETSLTQARLSYIAGLYKITLNRYRLMETMGLRIW
jgi:outer membrane protein